MNGRTWILALLATLAACAPSEPQAATTTEEDLEARAARIHAAVSTPTGR